MQYARSPPLLVLPLRAPPSQPRLPWPCTVPNKVLCCGPRLRVDHRTGPEVKNLCEGVCTQAGRCRPDVLAGAHRCMLGSRPAAAIAVGGTRTSLQELSHSVPLCESGMAGAGGRNAQRNILSPRYSCITL